VGSAASSELPPGSVRNPNNSSDKTMVFMACRL
jgi:hypothetical protein